ncbi:hypothetical protein PABG_05044 [Paracoccidioides brasiliensis Pb03]|nr:hypothetical protein PABG_05044 [Paracoccidioides brasiliensis Pb03]
MSFVGWLLSRNASDPSHPSCPITALAKGGTIIINNTFTLTLTENAVFKPSCTEVPVVNIENPTSIADIDEPFYASTSPQMYAIATATVVSYLLVIILFITPRTFFIGGRGGGGASFLGRRGRFTGSYGGSSVIGVGGRPWLQKVAAVTTAVSLSIATADSFRVAKSQYDRGYIDSSALAAEVIGGVEIRIVRIISSTFLWLAQVQTLIRLFPRHKEKVIIKWTGFALIVLDVIFSLLNSFINRTLMARQPRNIVEAIPALNYLFDLSLSLLYAAWVIFYGLSKHRFAFFHPKMRNICLVALLSLIAVLIPIVFFVLDLSKPNIAGWGEYIRWVGAAAASVVVWEWVERIEALERDENKDGILGREIFDGDEMLEVTPSEEVDWPGQRSNKPNGGGGTGSGPIWGLAHRPLKTRITLQSRLPRTIRKSGQRKTTPSSLLTVAGVDAHLTPTQLTTTPVSRADTTSAASTVYRVRYHSMRSFISPNVNCAPDEQHRKEFATPINRASSGIGQYDILPPKPVKQWFRWIAVPNPFKRQRASPPIEVATAQATVTQTSQPDSPSTDLADDTAEKDKPRNIKSKLDMILTYLPWEKGRCAHEYQDSEASLPVTVIPAPARVSRLQSPHRHREVPAVSTEENYIMRQDDSNLPVMLIPVQPRSSRAWSRTTVEPPSPDEDLNSTAGGTSPHSRTPIETPQLGDSNERGRSDLFVLGRTISSRTTNRASSTSISSVHAYNWGARRIFSGTEVPVLREEEDAIIQVVMEDASSSEDSASSPPSSEPIHSTTEQPLNDEGHINAPPGPSPSMSSPTPTTQSRHVSFSSTDHGRDRDRTHSATQPVSSTNLDRGDIGVGGSSQLRDIDLEVQHRH